MLELRNKIDIPISVPLNGRLVVIEPGGIFLTTDFHGDTQEVSQVVKDLTVAGLITCRRFPGRVIKTSITSSINLGFVVKGAIDSWENYSR